MNDFPESKFEERLKTLSNRMIDLQREYNKRISKQFQGIREIIKNRMKQSEFENVQERFEKMAGGRNSRVFNQT